MPLNNVLMISYYAPPLNTPAAVRVGKFAKYLPEFGWNPIILTVKDLDYYPKDETIFAGVNEKQIIRTDSLDPMRFLKQVSKIRSLLGKKESVGTTLHQKGEGLTNKLKSLFPVDDKIGWFPFCFRTGEKIIKQNKIAVIYCTLGGTNSHAIAAYKLAKKYNIPLLVEQRDPWVDHIFTEHNWYNHRLNSYWEKKVLNYADKIVTVTQGFKKIIDDKYAFDENKTIVIYNGFDDTYDNEERLAPDDYLTITFAGSMYKDITPFDIFEALKGFKDTKIRLQFIGNFRNTFFDLRDKYQKILPDNVIIEHIPRILKSDLNNYLNASDLLMILLPNKQRAGEILTTKFYDYLPIKKPILAIAPDDGELADLINTNNLGYVINAGDKIDAKEKIRIIISDYENGRLKNIHGNDIFINQFTRRNLTKQLAREFDKLHETK